MDRNSSFSFNQSKNSSAKIDVREAFFGNDPLGISKNTTYRQKMFFKYKTLVKEKNSADQLWAAFIQELVRDFSSNQKNFEAIFKNESFENVIETIFLRIINTYDAKAGYSPELQEFKNLLGEITDNLSASQKTLNSLKSSTSKGIPLAFILCNSYSKNSLRHLLVDSICFSDSKGIVNILNSLNEISELFLKKKSLDNFGVWKDFRFWNDYTTAEIDKYVKSTWKEKKHPLYRANLALFGVDPQVVVARDSDYSKKAKAHIISDVDSETCFCGLARTPDDQLMFAGLWSSWQQASRKDSSISQCKKCAKLGEQTRDTGTADKYSRSVVRAEQAWKQIKEKTRKDFEFKIQAILFNQTPGGFDKDEFVKTAFKNNLEKALNDIKNKYLKAIENNPEKRYALWKRMLGEQITKDNPEIKDETLSEIIDNAIKYERISIRLTLVEENQKPTNIVEFDRQRLQSLFWGRKAMYTAQVYRSLSVVEGLNNSIKYPVAKSSDKN